MLLDKLAEAGKSLGPPASDPVALLADLVTLFDESRCRPLPFFPRTAWAIAAEDDAAARRTWRGGYNSLSLPDSADRNFRTCFGDGYDPLADPQAVALAHRVFGPLRASLLDGVGDDAEDGP